MPPATPDVKSCANCGGRTLCRNHAELRSAFSSVLSNASLRDVKAVRKAFGELGEVTAKYCAAYFKQLSTSIG